MQWALAYLGAAIVFAVLDFIWLSRAGPRLYRPMIGPLLAEKASLAPAIVFYLVYVGGLAAFAVAPALETGGWGRAALLGAGVGLIAYATYNLTNQATLKIWPLRITLIDIGWGMFVSAAGAVGGFVLASRFG